MKRLLLAALVLAISAGPPIARAQTTPVPIDELPAAGTLTGTELVPAEQLGTAVATTVNQIRSYANSNLPAISLSTTGSGGISGILQVPNGGTGTSSLFGLLKGNGTSALTAAAAADIQALYSGCVPGTYLGYGGLCSVPASSGVSAVSLTAPTSLFSVGGGGSGSVALSLAFQTGLPASEVLITPTAGGTPAMRTLLGQDIPATNLAGGTGNGGVFGTLPVMRGGTGAPSLTGLLVGNGTSPFGAATFSNVISLFSGCTSPTTQFPRADGTCAVASGGSGITSLALTAPSVFNVGNSPLTSAGTLALTFATGQAANQVLASPNGTSGAFGPRALVGPDIPAANLAAPGNGGVFGNLPMTNLGSGTGASATTCLHGNATWGVCGTVSSANPSALVGPTAVIGSATTLMTSDSAPAINLTATYPWTGPHTFGAGIGVGSSIALKASGEIDANNMSGTLGQVLTSQGSGNAAIWSSVSAPTTGANPTAKVGSTANNGVATTFMRSDASPAICLTCSFSWNGPQLFSGALNTSLTPGGVSIGSSVGLGDVLWIGAGSPTDEVLWDAIAGSNGVFAFRAVNSAFSAASNWLTLNRTGDTVSSATLNVGNLTVAAPASGVAFQAIGLSGTDVAVFNSGSSATSGNGDVAIIRAGSTANAIQQGPNLVLDDSTNGTDTTLQQSGGQTELWQFNGAWRQIWRVPTTGGMVIDAPASGTALTANGLNGVGTIVVNSTGSSAPMAWGWDVGISSGAWNLYSQSTDPLVIGTAGTGALTLVTDGIGRETINSAGVVTIEAPTSGSIALSVLDNIQASSGGGATEYILANAGTHEADTCLNTLSSGASCVNGDVPNEVSLRTQTGESLHLGDVAGNDFDDASASAFRFRQGSILAQSSGQTQIGSRAGASANVSTVYAQTFSSGAYGEICISDTANACANGVPASDVEFGSTANMHFLNVDGPQLDIVGTTTTFDGSLFTAPNALVEGSVVSATGNVATPTSGFSVDLQDSGGNGYLTAFNHSTAVGAPLILRGSDVSILTSNGVDVLGFQQFTNGGVAIGTPTNANCGPGCLNAQSLQVEGGAVVAANTAGNVTIPAPTTGNALSATGSSSGWTAALTASSATSNSNGLLIVAGTDASDFAINVVNAANSLALFRVQGDGTISFPASGSGMTVGGAAGANLGPGTINAEGLAVNAVNVCLANGANCPASAGQSTGTFTITVVSCTGEPTFAASYVKIGVAVTVSLAPWGSSCTPNASGEFIQINGLPSAIQPAHIQDTILPFTAENTGGIVAETAISGGSMFIKLVQPGPISGAGTVTPGGPVVSGYPAGNVAFSYVTN